MIPRATSLGITMKLVNISFAGRMKDFLSPDMVYEGVGGTGEKCRVQAAVSVCSVPSFRVCCPCLLHDAGADLAGTTSFVPPSPATPAPSLAALAAAQLCVVS